MKYQTEVRLKDQSSADIEGPTQIILHSLANGYNFEGGVGWLEDPSNPLEAHFAIAADGHRVQIVALDKRADANYNANRRAISIETDSSVNADESWTDDQVESIVELVTDLCRRFSIPARLCPEWDAPGIGWHIMFGSPGAWTPVSKACPGPARIEQVKNVIVPRVAAALSGKPPATQNPDPNEDDDMYTEDDRKRDQDVKKKVDRLDRILDQITTNPDGSKVDQTNAGGVLRETYKLVKALVKKLGA